MTLDQLHKKLDALKAELEAIGCKVEWHSQPVIKMTIELSEALENEAYETAQIEAQIEEDERRSYGWHDYETDSY